MKEKYMKQHPLKTSVWVGLVLALTHLAVSSPIICAQQNQGSSQVLSSKEIPVSLKIAPGDLLRITVFDVPEMEQDVRVGANGKAQLALIGDIALSGLTSQEAAETIASELRNRKLLLRPQVNVLIKEYASQGVSIVGEVQHPGIYQVLGPRSLLDLISMSGGLTNLADTRITVKRRGGAEEKITAKLKTDDAEASLANNVQINPGDLILVPRAGIVYVLGEVNRPGGFAMQDSGTITLLQALAQAGGASRTASLSKAVLMRKNGQGYVTTKLQVGKIERGQAPDLDLHANDILFVPNSRLKSVASGTQSVANSLGSASIYAIVH
jgi:polysaccharide biosynthesis/export protein